jgi:hypothetical protein
MSGKATWTVERYTANPVPTQDSMTDTHVWSGILSRDEIVHPVHDRTYFKQCGAVTHGLNNMHTRGTNTC